MRTAHSQDSQQEQGKSFATPCEACLTEVLETFVFVEAVGHAVVSSHADRLALNGGHVGTGLHHPAPRKTPANHKEPIVLVLSLA